MSLKRRHCPCSVTFIFIVSFLAIGLLAPDVSAQFYFGRNKVQYTDFDWQVMTTEHFRLYFYREESEIAKIGAQIAEDAYRRLAQKFNIEVDGTTPLIIYATPSHFSQTNIVPGVLPESVGGFTEFLKGRVVLPFNGNYHDFVHVINHEMVHVFMLAKLDQTLDRHSRVNWYMPPLWFVEGLAEFWSKEWDTQADYIIKDMVLNNHLPGIPDLYSFHGSYFMYKLGESVCTFIDSAYGPDKLILVFENWPKAKSFDEVVKVTLGDDLRELSRKWEYSLKQRYYPTIGDHGLPKMESRRLTRGGIAVRGVPIRWDDGDGERDYLVYKANRLGYSEIYLQELNGPDAHARSIIKGERSSRFESLHMLRSGIDANDSGLVVFSSKCNERDVLYVYDLNVGKVIREFSYPDLVSLRSPRLSPDSRQIVFYGMEKSGFSDIYVLTMQGGRLDKVTDDIYDDTDPVFTPDGDAVVFVSDRAPEGQQGATNLFRLDLTTGTIRQLTYGLYKDIAPDATSRGIFFSSDREDGTFNLMLLDDDGRLVRQSTFVTAALNPRLSSDGESLVYTGYEDLTFQNYLVEIPEDTVEVSQPLAAVGAPWQPQFIDREFSKTSIKYDSDYSLDIAQSAIAYDPVYGSLGGIQAAMSDMLGNKVFYFLLSNSADTKGEFLSSFNIGITYLNRENRLNWGVGFYHLYNEFYNDFDQYFNWRQAGALGMLSYPISKFDRIELSTYARYSKKDRRYGLEDLEGFLVTHYLSFVSDNSIWDFSGPIDGRRYNITVGMTYSVDQARSYNRLVLVDLRHYFRLGRYSAFANRLFAYSSSGLDPQRIYLGGSWSFRGYSRREFYNRNVLFASNELRFPLIDALFVGFPIGGLGFRGIRGALFFDVGSAWDDSFDQFLGSFGTGFRVNLGYVILLRFDFSRTTDFDTISPTTDFDFFFGWNF